MIPCPSTSSVSVIIPTYNRAQFLNTAIDSVLAQTFQNFELIVVDDGSDDHTTQILEAYGPRLVVVRQKNQGPAAARNTGIRAARHDLLAFLDSDDRFDRRKLEIQVEAMARQPQFLVSHTDELWYRNGKILNQKKRHQRRAGDIFAQSLELCAVGMSTVIMRRRLLDLVGFFNETLPCCEDYDLWLRTSCRHEFLHVELPLTIKDGGRPDQVSVQYRIGMDRFRIASILELLAAKILTPEQERLAAAELVKKCRIYGNGCLKHGREEGSDYLKRAALYQKEFPGS